MEILIFRDLAYAHRKLSYFESWQLEQSDSETSYFWKPFIFSTSTLSSGHSFTLTSPKPTLSLLLHITFVQMLAVTITLSSLLLMVNSQYGYGAHPSYSAGEYPCSLLLRKQAFQFLDDGIELEIRTGQHNSSSNTGLFRSSVAG